MMSQIASMDAADKKSPPMAAVELGGTGRGRGGQVFVLLLIKIVHRKSVCSDKRKTKIFEVQNVIKE